MLCVPKKLDKSAVLAVEFVIRKPDLWKKSVEKKLIRFSL